MSKGGSEGMFSLVKRWLVSALGVWLGSYLLEGIHYDDKATLVWVVLLFGLFSAVLKPILVLLALPFVVLTFGLGILVINALLYLLVGRLLDGFSVDGFGSAFLGALIITLLNMLFSSWITGSRPQGSSGGSKRVKRPRKVKAKDDVIDI